jgi:hypothetical protein
MSTAHRYRDQGLEVDPTGAATASATDDFGYLLAVMTKRAEIYPSLQAVKAVALLATFVLAAGGRWVRWEALR